MGTTKKRWRMGQVIQAETATYQHSGRVDQRDALYEFRARIRAGESRLALLCEFAERKVWREQSYRATRGGRMALHRASGRCFACQRLNATHRHHVIQVQHGGRNTRSNLVRLCVRCHAEVHPWMDPHLEQEPLDEWRHLPVGTV